LTERNFQISAFADELGPDVDMAFDVLARIGVGEIQLRGAWGKNVMELSPDELSGVRSRAEERGLGFHAIGSPIGKTYLSEPASASLDAVRHAASAARAVGAERIRVFSFYLAEGETAESMRDEVLDRLNAMVEVANDEGVMLVHENESAIYGDTAARCDDLLTNVPGLEGCFDFANFLAVGERDLYNGAWKLLKDETRYFDIKDIDVASGNVVVAGAGDGDCRKVIHEAIANGFDDRFNLEPHLAFAGPRGGLTSTKQFESAVTALKEILNSAP
jgi:3-dehydroshikimate dehydratase